MASLLLRVVEGERNVQEIPLHAPLEIGRQRQDELGHELYALIPGHPLRLLVARQSEGNVSRQHLLLEPLPSGAVRVTNRSQIAVPTSTGAIAPGTSRELIVPFSVSLPPRTLHVLDLESIDEEGFESLDQPSVGPSFLGTLSTAFRPPPPIHPSQARELMSWLHGTLSVLQSAIGAADFLDRAAHALIQIVGLDAGRILLFDRSGWQVVAAAGLGIQGEWSPSRHVLDRVRTEKRTFLRQPRRLQPGQSPSLDFVCTVVAAPILDGENAVIGILYGERQCESPTGRGAVSKLEAMLVDLLACGVSAGLARQAQEKAALRAGALFEQFFTPQLARTLQRQPDLLQGRDTLVTLLFCDVRGFSAAAEKMGPAQTMTWMNEVMETLSLCVQAKDGVLVDYIGDELMAMWGAPEDQPDQAERAVRAALAMLQTLPQLNEKWQAKLGKPMSFGIGINSGPAHVGNTGSSIKFKYGPLGNNVNLASRVQGLTKYLRCRLLVTRATRDLLGTGFISRRVVKARVVNIEEPVDLYEIDRKENNREAYFARSESALDALERGDFALAARTAGELLLEHRGDGPLLLTLSRASIALMNEGADFDPVWTPPGK